MGSKEEVVALTISDGVTDIQSAVAPENRSKFTLHMIDET
jgi:hypothetical protein